jgi:glycosyltransferase involved in cell wall biosynthesis
LSVSTISFSVIIPTYNRLPLLQKTLGSIFRLDYPDFEIVVVNDGSADGTRDYLDGLQSAGKLRCYHQPNQGPARGRNLGLTNSGKEFIAFIDDDCIAPPDWLTRYARRLSEWGCDGIGGSAETGNPGNIFALTNDHIMNFFKSTNSVSRRVPFLTSNNAVYRKAALLKVGGFDPGFRIGAEERDLNIRLAESGATLRYDGEIRIRHFNDETFGKFLRHQVATGMGSSRLYAKARARSTTMNVGATKGDYLRLLFSPFEAFGGIRAVKVIALIILAQAAVTFGYVRAVFSGYRD